MNDREQLIYNKAINDAREILIAKGEKARCNKEFKVSLITAECSQTISKLLKGQSR